MRLLGGLPAVAGLTVREAWRSRLGFVYLAVAAGFLLAVPRLNAVDDGSRLKLSVLAITSGIGFVAVLLALLVAPAGLRRDLDNRIAYTVFAKPLRPSTYLLGRWVGSLLWLLGGAAVLSLAGVAAVALQFRSLPELRRTVAPAGWEQVSAAGEVSAVAGGKDRISLAGMPGNGMRWRFTGLTAPGADGYELLLRTQVVGTVPDQPVVEAVAEVRAMSAGEAVSLPLDPRSPYGADPQLAGSGRVVLKHRDNASRDLGQDYLRLRLPASAIAADGSAEVQLTRLEGRSVIVVERDGGLLLAVPAGHLVVNLLRGGLVLTASCSLLAAWALFGAVVSNLGVTLLGGLTLFFAGSAHDVVRDTLEWEHPSLPVRRLLELLLHVVPDFNRFPVATELAAGRGVAWAEVGQAWLYFGAYAAVFLVAAWIALRRKEL
jgi:hypothetical protein